MADAKARAAADAEQLVEGERFARPVRADNNDGGDLGGVGGGGWVVGREEATTKEKNTKNSP